MSWRKFPLPLLMLGVALAPAGAARELNRAVAPSIGQLQPALRQAAASSVPNSAIRRRRDVQDEQAQISQADLQKVGEYLRCRSAGIEPDAALRENWESFHAWCDATIHRYAAGFRLRGMDVDDCAQEVWIDLVQKLPEFQLDTDRGSFSSWLYRVVQNKAMDMKRREARRPAVDLSEGLTQSLRNDDLGPSANQEREENRLAVRRAMQELERKASPQSYQVLHLRQMKGWSVSSVADALGLSAEQVWAREHRMKGKLEMLLRAGEGR